MKGKCALVTGASRSLGAAVARRLAAAGASVAVHYRQAQDLAEQVAADCGNGSFAIGADLAEPEGAQTLAARLGERWGRLDALVNNAAITTPLAWDDTTPEAWQNVLRAGLSGPYYCLRSLAPLLAAAGGAAVNVGSVAALNGGSLGPAYAAAKAGLLGLTMNAARTLGPKGVRVNAVCPGPIDSPLVDGMPQTAIAAMVAATPLGRLAAFADVADAVLWLCSDASRFVTGQTLVVDGGRVMH